MTPPRPSATATATSSMPDTSPSLPSVPTPGIFSGRKTSLFSKKSKPSLNTTLSSTSQYPPTQSSGGAGEGSTLKSAINASVTSLASTLTGGGDGSPRRSLSLRSHKSQSSGSLQVHKGRTPSFALDSRGSPVKGHRISRSISVGVTNQSPQRLTETAQPRDSPRGATYPPLETPTEAPPRTPFSMLVGQLGTLKRADTDRPPLTSYASTFTTTGAPQATVGAQGGYSPAAVYHNIRDTSQKRMATLDYLRKVHEGNVFYFSTISYNTLNLSTLPSLHPSRLGRRATNYLILGSSLPPLLELHAGDALDYLRALGALLAEYDTYSQLSSSESGMSSLTRGRVGQMFKSGMRNVKARRTSAAAMTSSDSQLGDGFGLHHTSFSSANVSSTSTLADSMPLPPVPTSAYDFQYLQTPNLPFDPDFGTSFSTLADVLIDAYARLLTLIPGPEACVPGVNDAFLKADKSLRKILISGIVNELGETTRKEAKAEVGGLGKLVLTGLM